MRWMMRAAAAVTVLAALTSAASAQDWPAKQINLIVPFSAGGTTDLFGRLLANHMQQSFGKPVIVENRAVAGRNIGAASVAKAAPDGYTSWSARCRPTRSTRSSIPSCPTTP